MIWDRDPAQCGKGFAHQFPQLGRHFRAPESGPGHVAAGSSEACDVATRNRITHGDEHDRHRACCVPDRCRGIQARSDDQRRIESDEFARQRRQSLDAAVGKTHLDRNVATFLVAEFLKLRHEGVELRLAEFARRRQQHGDPSRRFPQLRPGADCEQRGAGARGEQERAVAIRWAILRAR